MGQMIVVNTGGEDPETLQEGLVRIEAEQAEVRNKRFQDLTHRYGPGEFEDLSTFHRWMSDREGIGDYGAELHFENFTGFLNHLRERHWDEMSEAQLEYIAKRVSTENLRTRLRAEVKAIADVVPPPVSCHPLEDDTP
jgi:hypothetical protein